MTPEARAERVQALLAAADKLRKGEVTERQYHALYVKAMKGEEDT